MNTAVLRLLSRRRCLTCGEELPAPREYPMRVCAECILGTREVAEAERTHNGGSPVEPLPAA
jgi:hypothetical protein